LLVVGLNCVLGEDFSYLDQKVTDLFVARRALLLSRLR